MDASSSDAAAKLISVDFEIVVLLIQPLVSRSKDSSHGDAVEPATNVPERWSNEASSAERKRSHGNRCKTCTHTSDGSNADAEGDGDADSLSVSSRSVTANRMISDLSVRCASIPAATAAACRFAAEMSISESSTESGSVSLVRSDTDDDDDDDDGSEKRKSITSR